MSKPLTCKTAFGTELKHPVAAGLGGPGRTMTVGNRAMRPSTVPFLEEKKGNDFGESHGKDRGCASERRMWVRALGGVINAEKARVMLAAYNPTRVNEP